MKKIITAISLILCICINAYAFDISNWAEESFNNMSSYGILNLDIVRSNMKENITRKEFCQILMNIYKCDKRVVLSENDINVFDDTNDEAILEAYKVGIVSGIDERLFGADNPITRQEMAVMLSRTLSLLTYDYNKYDGQVEAYIKNFTDHEKTASWALTDMASICDYEIITGNDLNEARPLDNASKEQAICMLDRVYKRFIQNTSVHTVPKFKAIDKNLVFEGEIVANWQSVPGAKEYYIIVKTDNSESIVITLPQNVNSINQVNDTLKDLNNYTIILGVTRSDEIQTFSKPVNINKKVDKQETQKTQEIQETVPEAKPQPTEPEVDNSDEAIKEELQTPIFDSKLIHSTDSFALSEKEKRVFPDGIYFETKELAEEYMVEVEVPAWRLGKDGTKTSYTAYIEVNKALAEDVINIFTEIYNDAAQFPIKDVGGFSWRNTSGGRVSQHSYGTCIDINYNENYYVEPDGTPITGELWLPNENPFSIAEDSIVVKTFAKYGWLWGGNAWSDKYAKDYMHFTYLGK